MAGYTYFTTMESPAPLLLLLLLLLLCVRAVRIMCSVSRRALCVV